MNIKLKDRVKELREKAGINQTKLAEVTKTTRQQIGNIEKGIRGTSIENLWNIADYFNVSADYLLGRSDDDSPFRKE